MEDAFLADVPHSDCAIIVTSGKEILIVWTELDVSHLASSVKGHCRSLFSDIPQEYIFVQRATDEEVWVILGPGDARILRVFVELQIRCLRLRSIIENVQQVVA